MVLLLLEQQTHSLIKTYFIESKILNIFQTENVAESAESHHVPPDLPEHQ
jgi:hypothetical protein